MCSDVVEGFSEFESESSLNASRNRASEMFDQRMRRDRNRKVLRMVLAASFVLVAISSVVLIGDFNRQNADKSISRYEPASEDVFLEEPRLKTDDSLDNMALNKASKEKKIETREPEQMPAQPESVEEEATEENQNQEPKSETLVLEELNVVEDDMADVEVDDEEMFAIEIPEESKDTQSEADESVRLADDVNITGGVKEQTPIASDSGQKSVAGNVSAERPARREAERTGGDMSDADIDVSGEVDETAKIAVDMAVFEEESEEGTEPISFALVEEKPEFPGGDTALINFISTHTEYPEIAKEEGIQGRVYVGFVIDADGSVTDVSLVRGVDPVLDVEAIRVVRMIPEWKPGKQRGQTVPVTYIVPIEFSLD